VSEQTMVWAEFATGSEALAAARALRAAGHELREAFTPYPMPELEELLGLPRPRLLLGLTLLGAFLGGGLSYLIMWWTSAVDYPLDVGGRPLNSFVTDIPIMFESAVLAAALSAFSSTLLLSGLPRLHHPLDSLPGFQRTSMDRFWLGFAQRGTKEPPREPELARLGALRTLAPEHAS
jgi:ActD protein